MKVSDAELNRLCAEVCGWTQIYPGMDGLTGTPREWKRTGGMRKVPDFCRDRNALPELLRAIPDGSPVLRFGMFLGVVKPHTVYYDNSIPYTVLLLPPRQVCIAALKALSKWPDSWETEEPE